MHASAGTSGAANKPPQAAHVALRRLAGVHVVCKHDCIMLCYVLHVRCARPGGAVHVWDGCVCNWHTGGNGLLRAFAQTRTTKPSMRSYAACWSHPQPRPTPWRCSVVYMSRGLCRRLALSWPLLMYPCMCAAPALMAPAAGAMTADAFWGDARLHTKDGGVLGAFAPEFETALHATQSFRYIPPDQPLPPEAPNALCARLSGAELRRPCGSPQTARRVRAFGAPATAAAWPRGVGPWPFAGRRAPGARTHLPPFTVCKLSTAVSARMAAVIWGHHSAASLDCTRGAALPLQPFVAHTSVLLHAGRCALHERQDRPS